MRSSQPKKLVFFLQRTAENVSTSCLRGDLDRARQARTTSHFLQPLTLLPADPCREKSAFDCAVEVASRLQSRLELRTHTLEEEATDERPPTDSALRGRGRMSELNLGWKS